MRIVLQRCKQAQVTVDDEVIGQIGAGLLLLVGISTDDNGDEIDYLADKVVHLRIFEDESGKMNHSIKDVGGQILSVSQFTLYGDCRKGRRPSFSTAAAPQKALELYERFNARLREEGVHVETGRFGAMMDVGLTNWGPVTLILDR